MTEKFKALKEKGWQEFSYNDHPKCPHCAENFDITQNDAWYLFDENEVHEVDCPSCGQMFRVVSSTTWRFSTDEQGDDDD